MLAEYKALLERYDAMIYAPSWWDGRRERLVAEMDRLFERMTRGMTREQKQAVDARMAELSVPLFEQRRAWWRQRVEVKP